MNRRRYLRRSLLLLSLMMTLVQLGCGGEPMSKSAGSGGTFAVGTGGNSTGGSGGTSPARGSGGAGGNGTGDAAVAPANLDGSAGGSDGTSISDSAIPSDVPPVKADAWMNADAWTSDSGGTQPGDAADARVAIAIPDAPPDLQPPLADAASSPTDLPPKPDVAVSVKRLSVSQFGTGGGAITSSPPGINCGYPCSAGFPVGTVVTLTAIPDGSSTFAGWAGPCSGAAACVLTMDADQSVQAYFTGIRKPPILMVSPSSIDLGTLQVGVSAPLQTITITASAALSDLYVAFNGPDIIRDATSTCTSTLAAGASCTVVLNFLTSTNGPKSDSLSISAGDLFVSVPITAVLQSPAKLLISPTTRQSFLTTMGVPSPPITFGVANSGDVWTGPLVVTITGTNAADFTATPIGALLIPPVGAMGISVVFTPQALSATAEVATLTITDSGPGASTVSVGLSGTVRSPVDLVITPPTANFGSVSVGAASTTYTFNITNTGNTASGALTVGITAPEFVKTADTCTGVSLANATTCTVGIQFKPTSAGAKNGFLVVNGTSGTPVLETLTGAGV